METRETSYKSRLYEHLNKQNWQATSIAQGLQSLGLRIWAYSKFPHMEYYATLSCGDSCIMLAPVYLPAVINTKPTHLGFV